MGQPDLQEAVRWATEMHAGQWREGDCPLPYVCHPVEVTQTLRHVGEVTDEAMLCAAVLHDVVEETEATHKDIHARFGPRVAELVSELTRREPTPEQCQDLSKDEVWALRADMLLEDVKAMSAEAQTVKLCDRISNLREAQKTKKGKKLARYLMQSERFLDVIPRTVNRPLWDALDSLVKEARRS